MNNEPEKRRCDHCRIAEAEVEDIREERDKWARVAVALQKCRLHPQSDKVYSELDDAIAALGYEWDEAVR